MQIVDLTSTVPTTNYTVGRRSRISQISEHHVVGDASHAINKARIQGQEFSPTFTIGMDGTVYRLVAENNTPYTDNDFSSNSRSVTIEHAGGGSFPYTEAMYQASIELHKYLFGKYGNLNCVRHRDIPEIKADPRKATLCPGQLDVERIVEAARKGGTMSRLDTTDEEWAELHKVYTGDPAPNPKTGNPHEDLSETINLLKNLPAAKERKRRADAFDFHVDEIAKRDKGIDMLRNEIVRIEKEQPEAAKKLQEIINIIKE